MDSLQAGLTRLSLQPDDVLLVQVNIDPPPTIAQLEQFADVLERKLSGVNFIWSRGVAYTVLRNGVQIPHVVQPAVIVDVPISVAPSPPSG